jgi:recombination protein RecT
MTPRAQAPARAVAVYDPVAAGRALTQAVEERRPQLAALLGVELESERGKAIVDRFVTVALHAATSRPDLPKATRESLVESIRDAAMLGLEPVGATGDGAIVVYHEKRGDSWVDVARFQPMYRGLLKLARRSDQLASIDAHVVYAGDQIELDLGSVPSVRHSPALQGRGKPIGAYAVAELTNGRRYVDWMPIGDIEAVRKVSKADDKGPWVSFWPEMARKTAIRRLMKRLPLETLAEHAMRLESEAEERAVVPQIAAPVEQSEARARLRARFTAAEEAPAELEAGEPVTDGAGAAEVVEVAEDTAEVRIVSPSQPEPTVSGDCGAGSDPALGAVETCNLAPGHSGRGHKRIDLETGEVLATWPVQK